MEIIHYKDLLKNSFTNVILGIGKFDGFHLGHQKIINTILNKGKGKKSVTAVFTFRHFPADFYIYPWEERLEFLDRAGIETCIWSDFEEISFWEPEKFLKFIEKIGVKEIIVGFNFAFGSHRKGNIEFLKRESDKKEFSLSVVEPVKVNREIVNSTKIRNFLKISDIEKVSIFLGRHFSFKGKVITGDLRGRVLDYPTANLYLFNKLDIGDGIYAGWILYEGKFYKGAINIGVSPTFRGKEKKIEVYLLDFTKEIYGEILEVFLVKKLRDEICFPSKEDLKKQIKKDVDEINALSFSTFHGEISIHTKQ